jgi:hypothetical protein
MLTANPEDPAVEVINMGMPMRGVISNSSMPYTRTKAYNQALTSDADVLMIMIGTADGKNGLK